MRTDEAVKLVKKALWIGPENPIPFQKGTVVLNYEGTEKGICTGGTYRCQMEGCLGLRVVVRWPDGKITRPCTKGMRYDKKRKAWRIG